MSAPAGQTREPLDPDLVSRVRTWVADDPDPATREELTATLAAAEGGDAAAAAELTDAFSTVLEFGTAGLRGRLGAGPNRMNRAVVIRTAAGLAGYLTGLTTPPASGEMLRVAVGFDARHGSRQFALDTAAVLVAAGIEVLLLPGPLPTPTLAWLTRHHPCDAGVMVTASHNPPQDNGYKVYLGGADGGTLIVPPADVEISAQIARIGRVADVPRATSGWTQLTSADLAGYLAAAAALAPPGPRDLRVVATPLHGVGGDTLVEVLARAGFHDVTLVASQARPDPDFPTVAFPNPEEAGALDAAIATAVELAADLVVANDPDSDRCALAVPDPSHPAADRFGWRMLRGDELGVLLADFIAERRQADGSGGTLACSIVSSTQLGAVAAAHGLDYARTLTGFKWIARAPGLVFGYEEALGYCVAPDLVRDKDGITAAVLACHLAASAKASGTGLPGLLDDLAVRDGLHCTDQLSVRVRDLSVRGVILDRVAAAPPTLLGGEPVDGIDDLAAGIDGAPGTEGLRLRLPDGWVIVRPSGTEPKLKAYVEVRVEVPEAGDRPVLAARALGARRLAGIARDLAVLLAVE